MNISKEQYLKQLNKQREEFINETLSKYSSDIIADAKSGKITMAWFPNNIQRIFYNNIPVIEIETISNYENFTFQTIFKELK